MSTLQQQQKIVEIISSDDYVFKIPKGIAELCGNLKSQMEEEETYDSFPLERHNAEVLAHLFVFLRHEFEKRQKQKTTNTTNNNNNDNDDDAEQQWSEKFLKSLSDWNEKNQNRIGDVVVRYDDDDDDNEFIGKKQQIAEDDSESIMMEMECELLFCALHLDIPALRDFIAPVIVRNPVLENRFMKRINWRNDENDYDVIQFRTLFDKLRSQQN